MTFDLNGDRYLALHPYREWDPKDRELTKEILGRVGTTHANVVDRYIRALQQATPDEITEGKKWYKIEAGAVHQALVDKGFHPEVAAAAIAAISPLNPWEHSNPRLGNKGDILRFAHATKKMITDGKVTVTPDDIEHANEIGVVYRFALPDGGFATNSNGRPVEARRSDSFHPEILQKRADKLGAKPILWKPPHEHGLEIGVHDLDDLSSYQLAHMYAFRSLTSIPARQNAIDVLLGRTNSDKTLRGAKVFSFADNILHPASSPYTTVDSHLINAGLGRLADDKTMDSLSKEHKGIKGGRGYHAFASAVNEAVSHHVQNEDAPLRNNEGQAIIWLHQVHSYKYKRR